MKKTLNKLLYSKKIKTILMALLVIYLLPFLYSVFLSVPSLDDFPNPIGINDNYFIECINSVINSYFTWQGQWWDNIVATLINPLSISRGFSNSYGIIMVLNFILLIISFYLFIKNIIKYYTNYCNSNIVVIIVFMFCVLVTNTKIYSQIFYWFCGSGYLRGIIYNLFLISLIIKIFNTDSTTSRVFVSIFGFLTCTGFNGAVFSGLFYLVLLINDYRNHKLKIKNIIPLVFMIIGGLTGVLAPGNFVRHAQMDKTGVHPVIACWYAIVDGGLIVTKLFTNPFFISYLIIIFIIGIKIKNDIFTYKYSLLSIFLYGVLLFFLCFPVALGYSAISFENRIYGFIDIISIIWLTPTLLYLGGSFARHNINFSINRKITTCFIVIFTVYSVIYYIFNNVPYIYTIQNLPKMKKANIEWREVYHKIENDNNINIDIYISKETLECPVLNPSGLDANVDNWVNKRMANFYGKDSIRFIVK